MAWKFVLEKEAEIFALLFEDEILRTDFLRTNFEDEMVLGRNHNHNDMATST